VIARESRKGEANKSSSAIDVNETKEKPEVRNQSISNARVPTGLAELKLHQA
jgi:hypothetical protein